MNEHLLICKWLVAIQKMLSQSLKDEFAVVKIEELPNVSYITTITLRSAIEHIKDVFIRSYEDNRQSFESVKRDTEKTATELWLFFISPYILALGLAIRLTKVSGELYPARYNPKQSYLDDLA
jgi:hypothetical protein